MPDPQTEQSKKQALSRVRRLAERRLRHEDQADELLLERNMNMVEARRLGATYAEIAEAAQVTRSVAHHFVAGMLDPEADTLEQG